MNGHVRVTDIQSNLFTDNVGVYAQSTLPGWMAQAECATGLTMHEADDLFFPDGRSNFTYVDAARDHCSECPVVAECLAYGLNEEYGLWGGKSPRQRRELRDGLRKSA